MFVKVINLNSTQPRLCIDQVYRLDLIGCGLKAMVATGQISESDAHILNLVNQFHFASIKSGHVRQNLFD